jgi:D-serine deaminase-like pyridoxal phosphate-dependent protein
MIYGAAHSPWRLGVAAVVVWSQDYIVPSLLSRLFRSPGFGLVVGHPRLLVASLYEEHAIVTSEETIEIPVGERLRVVPNHACACANLHERMLVLENSSVADVWSIDARGWTGRSRLSPG